MLWNRNRAVGVDIGEGSVKAVEVERNGHALKVVRTGVRSLPPTLSARDAEGMGAFLRDFFADCGFRSDRVYLGIPRHQAILRTLRVPPADEPETQQMIRFQARKVLPMNGEGLRIGFILREGEGEKTAVIVAAKEEVYRGYVDGVAQAGLRPAGVTLSSFGTSNAYLNAYHEGAPGVVVDIGARMTEITLAAYGRFAASRQASLGVEGLIHRMSEEAGLSRAASSQAIRGARLGPDAPPGIAEWAREVASEVDRTLRAFSTDGLPAPERVLLTGGGGQVGGLAPFLSEQIGVPVETFKQDAGLTGWPPNTANPGAQFVPALGYVLGDFAGLGTRFDFGADFFRKADAKPRPTRKVLLAVAALTALLAAFFVPDHYLGGMEKDLKEREKDVSEREKTAGETVGKLEKKLKDLRSWTWQGPSWIEVIREITLSVPESKEVYLTQVQFRAGGEPLRILGRAVNEDAVNRFVNQLTRSELVWLVERRNIQQHRDRKERHRWDFELKGFLVEPEGEVGPK
jgi:type IV pilus assembly protein PilM